MRTPDPAKAARDAAEAIRQLNHATLNQTVAAPALSSTTQALCALVDRLPQALEQIGAQLGLRHAQDAIRMDTGENPARAVAETQTELADAVRHLGDAARSLHLAASPLFHMAAKEGSR
jgi:hypothetical protein